MSSPWRISFSPTEQITLLEMARKPDAQKLPLHKDAQHLTLRDEANALIAYALRNPLLERFHDRFTDGEMESIVIETAAAIAQWLYVKEILTRQGQYLEFLESFLAIWCKDWERERSKVTPDEGSGG
jgi:hypothetical protein